MIRCFYHKAETILVMFYYSCHQINNNKMQPNRDGRLKGLSIYKLQFHPYIVPLSPACLQILMSVPYTHTHTHSHTRPITMFNATSLKNYFWSSLHAVTNNTNPARHSLCLCSCNDTRTRQTSNLLLRQHTNVSHTFRSYKQHGFAQATQLT